MTYQQLLNSGHIYDQSGITNPETYDWQPTNGIYYPVKKEVGDETMLLIEKNMKDAYNLGISKAISFCESQKQMYAMIDPSSPVPMVIDSIIKTLAHFKKV